ncbi:MAG: AI-2E family transporter [Betaproteobacteria bacterium]
MPTTWQVCSMRADDPGSASSAIAAVSIALPQPIESPGASDNAAAADTAQVEFVLPNAAVPAITTVKPRTRGTLPTVGMFVLMVITALYFGRPVLMPILLGIILAVVLSPVVAKLAKFHIAEPIAAALVLLAMLATLVLGVELLVLPAKDVLAELPVQVQNLLAELLRWARSFQFGRLIVPHDATDLSKQAAAQGFNLTGFVLHTAQGFIVSAISAMVLAYFLLSSGDLFLTKLVKVLPIFRDKVRAVTVVRTVQRDVATYFASVSMINLGLGLGVTLLTWGFGLPMPWFWGALVATLNFIPYVGAGTSAMLLLLAGMAFMGSTGQAFLLVVCFVAITFVEGQLINPLLVGKRLALNPTVVFVALFFWGWLWGVGGMLLAVPLLIIMKKFADQTPGWEAVAEFLAR